LSHILFPPTGAGFANAQYDTCYHQSCDTVDNINTAVLSDIAKTAAYAVQTLTTMPNLQDFLAGNGQEEGGASTDLYNLHE